MLGKKNIKRKRAIYLLSSSFDSTHRPVCYRISTDVQMDKASCCKGVIRAPL